MSPDQRERIRKALAKIQRYLILIYEEEQGFGGIGIEAKPTGISVTPQISIRIGDDDKHTAPS